MSDATIQVKAIACQLHCRTALLYKTAFKNHCDASFRSTPAKHMHAVVGGMNRFRKESSGGELHFHAEPTVDSLALMPGLSHATARSHSTHHESYQGPADALLS